MTKASRFHGIRLTAAILGLAVLVIGGLAVRGAIRKQQQELMAKNLVEQQESKAKSLVDSLQRIDTQQSKPISRIFSL